VRHFRFPQTIRQRPTFPPPPLSGYGARSEKSVATSPVFPPFSIHQKKQENNEQKSKEKKTGFLQSSLLPFRPRFRCLSPSFLETVRRMSWSPFSVLPLLSDRRERGGRARHFPLLVGPLFVDSSHCFEFERNTRFPFFIGRWA